MDISTIKRLIKNTLPKAVLEQIRPSKYTGEILAETASYQAALHGMSGIEVGGPSPLFRTVLPIYEVLANLDGVNFSGQTVWEGEIKAGKNFQYTQGRTGTQFISEASNLDQVQTGVYDFLLSCNCLEHVANPLKAVAEWTRVVKPGGYMLLVLPNKDSNFDHKRPVTTFAHMLDDFNQAVTEHDLTHLEEILALHDLSMDPQAGDVAAFKARSLKNFENRCLHHHIYDMDLVQQTLRHFGYQIIQSSATRTDYFVLGKKS